MSKLFYSSYFGVEVDDAITSALASGMELERIYAELAERTREVANALIAKHQRQEAEKCAA